jgi:tetratricopeptide (TPR) repeat protein
VKLLELALELDGSNVQAHLQLLTILARVDHFRHRAPREMQLALKKFPSNVHIMHLCASFLLTCGEDDAAAELLSRLASLQPQNGLVASTQGLLYMKMGQREAAACCFKRGMADTLAENSLLCHEELAKLAVLEGRPEVARGIFQHGAARMQPNSRFLREWGLFERKLGNFGQARALFQQSVELRAMDVRSWIAWALLERSQEDYTQALEVLRQVPFHLCRSLPACLPCCSPCFVWNLPAARQCRRRLVAVVFMLCNTLSTSGCSLRGVCAAGDLCGAKGDHSVVLVL